MLEAYVLYVMIYSNTSPNHSIQPMGVHPSFEICEKEKKRIVQDISEPTRTIKPVCLTRSSMDAQDAMFREQQQKRLGSKTVKK